MEIALVKWATFLSKCPLYLCLSLIFSDTRTHLLSLSHHFIELSHLSLSSVVCRHSFYLQSLHSHSPSHYTHSHKCTITHLLPPTITLTRTLTRTPTNSQLSFIPHSGTEQKRKQWWASTRKLVRSSAADNFCQPFQNDPCFSCDRGLHICC